MDPLRMKIIMKIVRCVASAPLPSGPNTGSNPRGRQGTKKKKTELQTGRGGRTADRPWWPTGLIHHTYSQL